MGFTAVSAEHPALWLVVMQPEEFIVLLLMVLSAAGLFNAIFGEDDDV
jgi:hypothetical protein